MISLSEKIKRIEGDFFVRLNGVVMYDSTYFALTAIVLLTHPNCILSSGEFKLQKVYRK